MRRIPVLLLEFLLLSSAAYADPITYDFNFVTTFGIAPTSGFITFDNQTHMHSILIVFDGTAYVNTVFHYIFPLSDGMTGTWSAGNATQDVGAFLVFFSNGMGFSSIAGRDISLDGRVGNGTFTIIQRADTVAPAPEPSSLLLSLFGMVGLAIMGRRYAINSV